jgi:hypothetical protein
MAVTTSRIFFDNLEAAANGLIAVLEDARVCTEYYKFGGLSAQQILASGLRLEGEIDHIVAVLDGMPGTLRHDE